MDISLKRIIAYILDILLVTLVATLISQIRVINPYLDKYMETYNEYNELIKKDETPDNDTVIQMNYDIYRYRIVNSSASVVCLVLYFGLYEFMRNGRTLGQKAMKLKIVSKNNHKRAGLINYIIRIIVLNNVLFTLLAMALVYFLSPKSFYYAAYVISLLQSGILLLNVVMIVMRNDHRGLHDMLSNTIVVPENEELESDELLEEKPKKTSIKEKALKKERRQIE